MIFKKESRSVAAVHSPVEDCGEGWVAASEEIVTGFYESLISEGKNAVAKKRGDEVVAWCLDMDLNYNSSATTRRGRAVFSAGEKHLTGFAPA